MENLNLPFVIKDISGSTGHKFEYEASLRSLTKKDSGILFQYDPYSEVPGCEDIEPTIVNQPCI